jgi:glycosyltransferase involved in cell wall biosynthesis
MKPPRQAAWVSSSLPGTGVTRLAQAWTAPLQPRPGFLKIYFNKISGRLEEIRTGISPPGVSPAGAGQAPKEIARGFMGLGNSAFLLSLGKRVPACDAYFVESQNLAFLRLPRACIVVCDLFYLTHPNSFGEKLQARIFYGGLDRYQSIMAISEYTKAQLVEVMHIPPERIHVFPLAYDGDLFKPAPADRDAILAELGIDPRAKVVLHLSSGERRKNFHGLMQAVARLLPDIPEIVLVKAGRDLRGRNREQAEAMAGRLGLGKHIHYLGPMEDRRLADLYRVADCFAFPSLAEGFGLPVLEAQACGCPTVTSNVTSLPEIAGPLARMVDPLDIPALAETIRAVLEDPGMRDREDGANRRWLTRFSWDPGVRFLENFLGLAPSAPGAAHLG